MYEINAAEFDGISRKKKSQMACIIPLEPIQNTVPMSNQVECFKP